MNRRYGGRILAGTLALPLAMAPAAVAQSLTPNPVIVSDFVPVTLDGTAKTTTATMSDFSVTDAGGAGWHVTVQATQFREFDVVAGQYVPGGRTLPAGSLTMPAPTVTPAAASITVPAGPHAIDGASVQLASAAAGTTGTYLFTQGGPLTLTLPSSAYARTYRSEVTMLAPPPARNGLRERHRGRIGHQAGQIPDLDHQPVAIGSLVLRLQPSDSRKHGEAPDLIGGPSDRSLRGHASQVIVRSRRAPAPPPGQERPPRAGPQPLQWPSGRPRTAPRHRAPHAGRNECPGFISRIDAPGRPARSR